MKKVIDYSCPECQKTWIEEADRKVALGVFMCPYCWHEGEKEEFAPEEREMA